MTSRAQRKSSLSVNGPLTRRIHQGFALQKFQDQVVDRSLGAHVVELADVGMIERGNGPPFTLEAFPRLRLVRAMEGKDLDRDHTVEASVTSAVHLAHSTRAHLGHDLVWTKPCTRC